MLPTILRGAYLHLYLMMDVWSRRIVGWKIADRGCAELAAQLVCEACRNNNVDPRGLVLHSDNGKPRHSAIRYITPDQRHSGEEHAVLERRRVLYERTRRASPGRWTNATRNWTAIGQVVLNPQRPPGDVPAQSTRQLP